METRHSESSPIWPFLPQSIQTIHSCLDPLPICFLYQRTFERITRLASPASEAAMNVEHFMTQNVYKLKFPLHAYIGLSHIRIILDLFEEKFAIFPSSLLEDT